MAAAAAIRPALRLLCQSAVPPVGGLAGGSALSAPSPTGLRLRLGLRLLLRLLSLSASASPSPERDSEQEQRLGTPTASALGTRHAGSPPAVGTYVEDVGMLPRV